MTRQNINWPYANAFVQRLAKNSALNQDNLKNYALEICGFFGKEYTPLGINYVKPYLYSDH